MSLTVRLSTKADFRDITELLAQLWPDKTIVETAFNSGIDSEKEIYITALLYNRIVGFASISLENSLYHGGLLAWVEALVSDKNVRGKGIGSALMSRVTEEALKRECKAIEIMIDNQTNAVKFVKNKGFQLRGNAFELKLV